MSNARPFPAEEHLSGVYDMNDRVTEMLCVPRPRADVLKFPVKPVAFSEVLTALTYALDLASSESSGHTLRACILGMNIGKRLFLAPEHMSDLYYALLLKDVGTTSNAVSICELMGMDEPLCRYAIRVFNWSKFEWRQLAFVLQHAFCDRPLPDRFRRVLGLLKNRSLVRQISRQRAITSETIARKFRKPEATIDAIRSVDEHWDGSGGPGGLVTDEIPLLAQICSVAQTLETIEQFAGRNEAVRVVEQRSGRWFDPGVVAAVVTMHQAKTLWHGVDADNLMHTVLAKEPMPQNMACDEGAFDDLCSAFADMIDAKSHYMFMHSHSVAQIAESMGREMGLKDSDVEILRRAALLHDIGMLGVPNAIFDQEGPLMKAQWAMVQEHPIHGYELLHRVRGFESIAHVVRGHHERLDGSGYPDRLHGDQIDLLSRILAVADVYDALCSPRPYRDNLPQEEILRMVGAQVPQILDRECFLALQRSLGRTGPVAVDAVQG
jgi:putative nucleotidyltransferase with HDIG domain